MSDEHPVFDTLLDPGGDSTMVSGPIFDAPNEKRPSKDVARQWEEMPRPPVTGAPTREISAWMSMNTIYVISELAMLEAPDGNGECLQWHVSISNRGRRAKEKDVRRALRAFRMEDAEEDNHHPGNARHFFLPVDPKRRVDCQCKDGDTIKRDPDGYTYSERHGVCAGCELAMVTGKACQTHGA